MRVLTGEHNSALSDTGPGQVKLELPSCGHSGGGFPALNRRPDLTTSKVLITSS